jgi:hypothetical protein
MTIKEAPSRPTRATVTPDTNLNNDISAGDTALWKLTGAGTFRLHVFTECVWAVVVRWK